MIINYTSLLLQCRLPIPKFSGFAVLKLTFVIKYYLLYYAQFSFLDYKKPICPSPPFSFVLCIILLSPPLLIFKFGKIRFQNETLSIKRLNFFFLLVVEWKNDIKSILCILWCTAHLLCFIVHYTFKVTT